MRRLLPVASLLLLGSQIALAQVAPQSYQDLHWRLLGPMRGGWSTCVEGVPDELDTYYFGAADGGVWKTNDSGVTWQSIADHAPFSSVGALAVAAGPIAGKHVIYVGSGQTQTRFDVMEGTGFYRSDDDGRTWTALGLADSKHIGRIWVDPRDPNVLLVAVLGHLYGPNAERGVFRSADGGHSWAKVAFVDADTGATDLAGDPAVPDVVYASFWQVRRYPWQGYHVPQIGPGSGIWKSVDGGKTWIATSRKGLPEGALGRIGIAVAPGTAGQRVYAVVDAPKNAGLYRSDDGGATWSWTNKDRSLTSTYMGRIFVDPNHADVVYAVGQSIRRSTDGGKTFGFLKGSPGGDDYHWVWLNPKHPERMVAASDQGTTVSVNGGETWGPWYNQPTGQFYRLGVDDRFPYWVYSGQQDSGTVGIASRSDYGQLTFRDWHPVGGDERDGDLPDPTDPRFVYGAGLGGRLSRWDGRTGRVTNVSPWPISSYGRDPRKVKYRTTWITAIATAKRAPNALYWGTQFLFRSLDKGWTWEQASPDLTGADSAFKNCDGFVPVERATACGYGVIFAIAPSSAADGLVWVGTDNGRVQLTRDDGKTWTNVTPPGLKDWSQVAAIDASPTDSATAYVAATRYRLDDFDPYVYATHDFGKTWSRIDGDLPRGTRVNVVRQDPAHRGLLYAGTRTGVAVSFDDGEHWSTLSLNLPTTAVNDIAVHGTDVILATQGRALWVLDDVTPLRYLGKPLTEPVLVPPAPAVRLSGNENRDTPLPPEMATTANAPSGALIDYQLPQAPKGPVVIDILDASGAIVRHFASNEPRERPKAFQYFHERWLKPLTVPGAQAGHNRFLWNLRTAQPKAPDYDFSIAATPFTDTDTVPHGGLVVPGKYTVRLKVDDFTGTAELTVLQDPRSDTPLAAMEAQFALLRRSTEALEHATRDLEAVAEEKAGLLRVESAGRPKALKRIEALESSHGDLELVAGQLASLVGDLEASDGPPTGPQLKLCDEATNALEKASARWQALKTPALEK
ncbi:MAG: hypothetical protein ABI609_09550 [Acidobacteriota bacterium]